MATFTGADKAIAFLFDMVANIADDYDSSSTYSLDAYVIYEGTLYKCINAISTPEAFTPAHWTAVLIMDEVAAGGGGGGSSTLAGLSDVSLSSLTNGDVLTYDSTISKWKNAAGGGGGSGETYSLQEQAVGVWVNGKTLYQKTVYIASVSTGTSYNHDIANVDEIFIHDIKANRNTGWFSSGHVFVDNYNFVAEDFSLIPSPTAIFAYVYGCTITQCYVTLRYTKTV